MYIKFKSENRLAVACLERNSELRWLKIKISEINGTNFSSKYSLFQNVKELIKSNETHFKISLWYVFSKSKRISDLTCVGKKFILSLFSYVTSELIFES